MKLLFCHSSCYSECSVSEQQISDKQLGNGEFIYNFRDSGDSIFCPAQQPLPFAAATLHHISTKLLCPLSRHGTEIHPILCWDTVWLDWLLSVRTRVARAADYFTCLSLHILELHNLCFQCRDKNCPLWECIKILYEVIPYLMVPLILLTILVSSAVVASPELTSANGQWCQMPFPECNSQFKVHVIRHNLDCFSPACITLH